MLPLIVSEPKRITRPVAGFAPSPWGDRFLNYTLPDAQVIKAQREMAKDLKEKVRRELPSIGDKSLMEQLRLIDSMERLGVPYHFKKEIDDALLQIYETPLNPSSHGLVITSLRFRLLRQHGIVISSDVFKEFIGSNGSLKEEVADDIHGILELYEACYVRVYGDDILEKVLPLTISKLNNSISGKVTTHTHSLLEESIKHALLRPLQKRVIRYDCVRYMQVYSKEDDPLHNKSLLKFAKLDFNLLQVLHREELSELCRYWKRINFHGNLPLRDRIVEEHAWSVAGYFEPHYSLGRKITCFGGHLINSIDDIYDAYTTLEEAEIFTQAVERHRFSGKLPLKDKMVEAHAWSVATYLEPHYSHGRKIICFGGHLIASIDDIYDAYTTLEEAEIFTQAIERWDKSCLDKLPKDLRWFYETTILNGHEELERRLAPIGRSQYVEYAKQEFDESRGLSGLFLECYMKEYGLTFDQACKELYKKIDELWKDINQCMTRPGEVAVPVYNIIINMGRAVECIYGGGEDGFTLANHEMKQTIKTMYIDQISM